MVVNIWASCGDIPRWATPDAAAAKLPPGWAIIGQMDWPTAIAFPGSPYSIPAWLSASMKSSSCGSASTGAEKIAAAVIKQPAPSSKRTGSGWLFKRKIRFAGDLECRHVLLLAWGSATAALKSSALKTFVDRCHVHNTMT